MLLNTVHDREEKLQTLSDEKTVLEEKLATLTAEQTGAIDEAKTAKDELQAITAKVYTAWYKWDT